MYRLSSAAVQAGTESACQRCCKPGRRADHSTAKQGRAEEIGRNSTRRQETCLFTLTQVLKALRLLPALAVEAGRIGLMLTFSSVAEQF